MYTIVYALRKHHTLRIFLTVALALGMAWAVGSGIRLTNATPTVTAPAVIAPANNATPDNSAARLNPASYNASNGSDQASALDQAIKNLSSIQRDRNSANTGTNSNNTNSQTTTGSSALQNNLSVGVKK